MASLRRMFGISALAAVSSLASLSFAQANSDPTYQALRHVALSGEAVAVKDFVLKRDAITFTLKSGSFCFTAPVNGKVTGAVFVGEGSFRLDPPIDVERSALSMLTRSIEPMKEDFGQLALRFSDSTYDDVKKAAQAGQAGGCQAGLLNDINDVYRRKFHYNISARLLQDVLSTPPGEYFGAMIKGRHYSGKEFYIIDPYGIRMTADGIEDRQSMDVDVTPEEVAFLTYDDMKMGVWTAFHRESEYASGKASSAEYDAPIEIQKQKLDTRIEKSGKLNGDAQTMFAATRDGLRVAPFALFSRLRVDKVTDAAGQPLSFIQEDKNDDPAFAVILPKALAAGETFTVHTTYSGKDAILNEGDGNYFPIARDDWYPNTTFGDYAEYEMSFSVPKGLNMVASGTLLKEINEGGESISTWKTEVAEPVAGFNFGKFRKKEAKLDKTDYIVQSFANENPPSFISALKNEVEGDLPSQGSHMTGMALGSMSTTSLMDKPLAEAQLAIGIYSNYFGPLPYKHLAMTQQTACSFGQSWPTLVYLPICSFYDSTVQHQLGLDDPRGYWKVVAPHEVAHQWWGQLVSWNSYRDQWMSEGFAEMSASLFMQAVYGQKDPNAFVKFWHDERDLLTERNKEGWRAIDAGPVTLGYRLANTRGGMSIPRRLIYPKGGYILHMVRMMMWAPRGGDNLFRETMQDFTKTYANRAATTEDFKAILEKHMTPQMDLDQNQRLDWFFNQYVYGTALPSYKFDYSFSDQNGTPVLKLKLTQANVDDSFKMLVPIYLETADGRVVRMGSAAMVGNKTLEQEVPLTGYKVQPKRAMLNFYADVLATEGK